jgi:hypothetical protein
MTPLELAEFQRKKGPIYNLLSLYSTHNGPLPRLESNSLVRTAIINELQRNHVRHNYDNAIDVNSNDHFTPREFRCLLQALLNGTLLPSQYSGRMLPYGLIAFLRSHVDISSQLRFDYALLHLDDIQADLRMYWSVIESDTIRDQCLHGHSALV